MTQARNVKPFIKWAGGKTQLLNQYHNLYPSKLKEGKIKRYIEPFLGSGAVFFDIIKKYEVDEVFLSDINNDLILTYMAVKDYLNELLEQLEFVQQKYYDLEEEDRKNFFYDIRDSFNNGLSDINYKNYSSLWVKRASFFIFLNRTCFNGLYRINSKGKFNVPFGKYKKPKILDKENLVAVNEVLSNVNILCNSYDEIKELVNDDTFIYFDPPYRPLSETSSFTSYSGNFTEEDQIKLARFINEIDLETEALVMLSNSDPSNTNEEDCFFEENYKGFNISNVYARRAINAKANGRGDVKELVIKNY